MSVNVASTLRGLRRHRRYVRRRLVELRAKQQRMTAGTSQIRHKRKQRIYFPLAELQGMDCRLTAQILFWMSEDA